MEFSHSSRAEAALQQDELTEYQTLTEHCSSWTPQIVKRKIARNICWRSEPRRSYFFCVFCWNFSDPKLYVLSGLHDGWQECKLQFAKLSRSAK